MTAAATLGQMLRHSAEQHTDRPVYLQGDSRHTYGELERRSGELAAGLIQAGLVRGDRTVLVLGNSFEYLLAYYAVVRAGGVVVPHYADARAEPLAHVMAHSGAVAAVVEGRAVRLLASTAAHLTDLRLLATVGPTPKGMDALPGLVQQPLEQLERAGAGQPPPDAPASADLATIVYTSGTTGKPKGVMLTHGNLLANIRSIVAYLELGPRDRVAMVLPFFYVYGNSVLHTHVCAGGSVAQVGTMAFPAAVLKGLERHRCTGLCGVPSTFERLLRFSGLAAADLSSLRYLTQAGGPMGPELTRRVRQALPGVSAYIMYGQTEASARLSYLPPEDLDRKVGSAGKAIPGVSLCIRDAGGQALPTGEVGEIVARGDNIMQGYWRDEAATTQALGPHGLRTGDLAYMDDEGYLFIQGRQSEMIKTGAHRVSPLEIEEAVCRHVGVVECGVVGVPDDLLGEAIAAFVVLEPGVELERRAVLRTCNKFLPRFKLPAHFSVVQALPRTPTGKLRRGALKELFLSAPDPAPSPAP